MMSDHIEQMSNQLKTFISAVDKIQRQLNLNSLTVHVITLDA